MHMILYLDLRRDEVTIAALDANDAKTARWSVLSGDNMIGRALDKAKKAFGLLRKNPSCVVLAVNAPEAVRNVSWSGVRQGVATANTLAFAWGVPVASVQVCGDESREAVAELALKAAEGAKKGEWISAIYSGEPSITKAKNIL